MNFWVLASVLAVLLTLRVLRASLLVWAVAWAVACYIVLKFGIRPPLPSAIIPMFMGIVVLSLAAYFSSSTEQTRDIRLQFVRFVTKKKYKTLLIGVVILIPLLAGMNSYLKNSKPIQPRLFGRTVHPAPPATIQFKGKNVDLIKGKNPYRVLEKESPEKFQTHVENGRRVYYENCHFCHGDYLKGDGMYAHGFNPLPADFVSPTTIAMLTESFMFWRIAKGGPGLPDESGPWSSSMPAWEKFLSEEEIWDVILFLYDYTGQKPRAEEAH